MYSEYFKLLTKGELITLDPYQAGDTVFVVDDDQNHENHKLNTLYLNRLQKLRKELNKQLEE